MNLKNSLFIIALIAIPAVAELPINIPDARVRQAMEYLDQKVNYVVKLFKPMPSSGGALCLNSSGTISKCTSAVDASGNCTCP
jgi:hypothetical protein